MIENYKTAFVAFGGNINSPYGEPRVTISAALEMLESTLITILKISSFYTTPAIPEGSGPNFVNAVAKISTKLNAYELLDKFHMIENAFDRKRVKRWSPRSIDIDLLTLEDQVFPCTVEFLRWATLNIHQQVSNTPKSLVLPHPRLHHRAFDWNIFPLALYKIRVNLQFSDYCRAGIQKVHHYLLLLRLAWQNVQHLDQKTLYLLSA